MWDCCRLLVIHGFLLLCFSKQYQLKDGTVGLSHISTFGCGLMPIMFQLFRGSFVNVVPQLASNAFVFWVDLNLVITRWKMEEVFPVTTSHLTLFPGDWSK